MSFNSFIVVIYNSNADYYYYFLLFLDSFVSLFVLLFERAAIESAWVQNKFHQGDNEFTSYCILIIQIEFVNMMQLLQQYSHKHIFDIQKTFLLAPPFHIRPWLSLPLDYPGAFWSIKSKTLHLLSLCSLIYRAQLKCAGVCDAPARSLYILTVNTVYYIIHNSVLQRDGSHRGPSEYGTPVIVLTCCPISVWPAVALSWFSFRSL